MTSKRSTLLDDTRYPDALARLTLQSSLSLVLSGLLLAGLMAGCAPSLGPHQQDATADAVRRTLYDNLDVNLLHVEVTVSEGVLYLDGEVEQVAHKIEAERAAAQVHDVRGVVNKLRVLP